MGYNSAIMICNDAMYQIDKDPAGWWQEAKRAIVSLRQKDNDGTFGFGNSNGFQAICCTDSSLTTFVTIGGNYATVLGYSYGGATQTEQDLMRTLAEKHGYKLVKTTK